MKIKIAGNQEEKNKVSISLENNKFEIVDSDEDYILIKSSSPNSSIIGKLGDEIFLVDPLKVMYFESDGNDILCISKDRTCYVREKLYQIELLLHEKKFIRISRSHVINTKMIHSIKATSNMKFNIKMENGNLVTVTRSYYHQFKEYFRI